MKHGRVQIAQIGMFSLHISDSCYVKISAFLDVVIRSLYSVSLEGKVAQYFDTYNLSGRGAYKI